jgi:signal transduction histidine kinase
LTAAIALVPPLALAYHNPRLHLVLVTTEALIALLAAFLALGRVRRRRRSEDLLLWWGLVWLAASNLVFAAIPSVFTQERGAFSIWTSLIGLVVGSATLGVAATARSRRLAIDRTLRWRTGGALVGALAAVALAVAALEDDLPAAVRPGFSPGVRGVHVGASPAVAALDAVGGVFLAVAAAGFARRADDRGDRLLAGLAVGCAWGAIARLNYLLFPSVFTSWVSTGDAFRLLFYISILGAAGAEIEAHSRSAAQAAALRERRRVAYDLHDGLAQEVASIQRSLRWLDEDDPHVRRALSASGRALAQARDAILALGGGSLAQTLGTVVQTVAEREGVVVTLEVDASVTVDSAQREALAWIASEAITNAARHGRAKVVHVEVVGHPRVRLRIADDGGGFDIQRVGGDGFGLIDMRERASAVGARLQVRSQTGAGTSIEVTL